MNTTFKIPTPDGIVHSNGEMEKIAGHDFFITSGDNGRILYLHDHKSGIPILEANDKETLVKEGQEVVRKFSSMKIEKQTRGQVVYMRLGENYPINK